jgi:dynein heavy chain
MSGSEFYWSKLEPSGSKLPGARYKHTTAVLDDKIIVFGGFLDSSKRFNDVWIFDTKSGQWSQPPPGQTETLEDGTSRFKRDWPNCPEPRGAHSATLIGDRMYVFGGYGGDGYASRDFNDLHVLDCYSWEWIALETTGDVPPPRSGHQAVAVGTDLYVFGGWNSVEEFDDMYVLDTELLEWTKLHEASGPSSFGAPRWNFSALSVFAVPYWKIFMFGGNSGHLIEDNNPQGTYKSDMLVYEIGRGEWSSPTVIGECPQGRSDTDMLYDLARGRIVLFGGWANRWFGDVHVCDVLDVVGPPYSVSSISPVI